MAPRRPKRVPKKPISCLALGPKKPSSASQEGFAMLPDKVVLKVFGSLTARELLQVRGVCRQWRDLALDHWLWTTKQVCVRSDPPQLIAAILRLAPCLGSLFIWEWEKLVSVCGLLLTTTSCAIHHLIMRFPAVDATLAALVLKRLASLGHLVQIQLNVTLNDDETLPNSRVRALLQELVYIKGLRVLCVTFHSKRGSDPFVESQPLLSAAAQLPRVPPPASLLCLAGHDFPECPLLLKWHKPTLEAVEFDSASCPGAAALLSGAPCLFKYCGRIMPDMLALLKCPALRELVLAVDLDESTRPHLPEVEAFLLAAASRLKDVCLSFGKGRDEAADLVLCLAGTKSTASALEYLELRCYGEEGEEEDPEPVFMRPLVAILPRLPHLTRLVINGEPSAALLEALEGTAVALVVD